MTASRHLWQTTRQKLGAYVSVSQSQQGTVRCVRLATYRRINQNPEASCAQLFYIWMGLARAARSWRASVFLHVLTIKLGKNNWNQPKFPICGVMSFTVTLKAQRRQQEVKSTNSPPCGPEAIARVSWNHPHPLYPTNKGHFGSTCQAYELVPFIFWYQSSCSLWLMPSSCSLPLCSYCIRCITHAPHTHAHTHTHTQHSVSSVRHYCKLQE